MGKAGGPRREVANAVNAAVASDEVLAIFADRRARTVALAVQAPQPYTSSNNGQQSVTIVHGQEEQQHNSNNTPGKREKPEQSLH